MEEYTPGKQRRKLLPASVVQSLFQSKTNTQTLSYMVGCLLLHSGTTWSKS